MRVDIFWEWAFCIMDIWCCDSSISLLSCLSSSWCGEIEKEYCTLLNWKNCRKKKQQTNKQIKQNKTKNKTSRFEVLKTVNLFIFFFLGPPVIILGIYLCNFVQKPCNMHSSALDWSGLATAELLVPWGQIQLTSSMTSVDILLRWRRYDLVATGS